MEIISFTAVFYPYYFDSSWYYYFTSSSNSLCFFVLYCFFPFCFHLDLLAYKVCSKKDRTFAIKTLFYNILSTVPFQVVPSTGDTPFPTFLPLLECFLERTFCDGAQFSYRIFLNLRVFKKRLNFLNSAPTSK